MLPLPQLGILHRLPLPPASPQFLVSLCSLLLNRAGRELVLAVPWGVAVLGDRAGCSSIGRVGGLRSPDLHSDLPGASPADALRVETAL